LNIHFYYFYYLFLILLNVYIPYLELKKRKDLKKYYNIIKKDFMIMNINSIKNY
jgi:hypothetical protein